MSQSSSDNWLGPALASVIILLTPLVNPCVSMSIGAAAIAGMAYYYFRRRRSWVGLSLLFAVALAVSMALVFWLTHN